MPRASDPSFPFLPPSKLCPLPPETPLLVAFSGGADSRLLLELTTEWAESVGAPVTAVHLHHGIRGAEADRDEHFCREACAELGVPLVAARADIPTRAARSGRSLELEARIARYDLFETVMRERHIPLLLTAHHADDQLETLLFRLLRGSGVHGLGGISPAREVPGGWLLRPLLTATRREILDECGRRGLRYVTDSTNAADDCTRNKLRHGVLPLLEEITAPGVPQRTATRLCEAAREDDDYLSAEADRQYATIDPDGDGRLSCAELCRLHPALSKRCLLRAYATATRGQGVGERSLTATHLQALLSLCETAQSGGEITLPGSWRGRITDGRLSFLPPGKTAPIGSDTADGIVLGWGDNLWRASGKGFIVTLESSDRPLAPLSGEDVLASAVFPDDLPRPLTLRTRRPGDTILSHGMTKKLKKLLCDKHIPQDMRDIIPAVCLPDGELLWFPTVAFRDGWKPPQEGGCIRITFRVEE